jgi:hypothetical protein
MENWKNWIKLDLDFVEAQTKNKTVIYLLHTQFIHSLREDAYCLRKMVHLHRIYTNKHERSRLRY